MTKFNSKFSRKNLRKLSSKAQEGQSLAEYSLLLGLIALAVLGIVNVMSNQVNQTFSSTTSYIGATSVTSAPDMAPPTFGAVTTPGTATAVAATPTPTGGIIPTVLALIPTVAPTSTPVPTSTPKPTATATVAPTNTPVPPTNTPLPTNTPVPPTATPVPPTSTPTPTATAVPPTNTPVPPTATTKPTATATVAPTNTPVPPTATPTPTTAAVSNLYTVNYTMFGQYWNYDCCGNKTSTINQYYVTITNKSSSAVNGWTISWKLDYGEYFVSSASYWNANCSISNGTVTCSNPSGYNNVMSANGGQVSFGIQLNSPNLNYTTPKTFTVNGLTVAAS